MKLRATSVLFSVLLFGACTPVDQPTGAVADRESLQGTWRPISMLENGKPLPDDRIKDIRLTLDDFDFTFATGSDSHSGLYIIDPEKNPKSLDISVQTGDETGKVYLAIYKFEDGKMIQCMQVSNEARPTEFTGDVGSGNLLEVWEKVE